MSKLILEKCGGSLKVETKTRNSTVFELMMPIKEKVQLSSSIFQLSKVYSFFEENIKPFMAVDSSKDLLRIDSKQYTNMRRVKTKSGFVNVKRSKSNASIPSSS
jgi:hypothetical protein